VTLKELGLPEDKQDWTAESAIGAARLVNNNPRKLDVDAMKAITRAAFRATAPRLLPDIDSRENNDQHAHHPPPQIRPQPFPIPTDLWIGGKWVEAASKKRVDVFDPSTGKKITDVADCDAADALAAVDAADKAAAAWAATTRAFAPRSCANAMRRSSRISNGWPI
jgi:hypothetical protein